MGIGIDGTAVGTEPVGLPNALASDIEGRKGGCGACGDGATDAGRGGVGKGVVGRAAPPGNGGAMPVFTGIGIATGAVGAACARAGIGDVGRIGTGSLPEGEICRDIVFGAGGGTGELLRTSVGAGGNGPELGTVIGVGAAMREAGIPGGVTTTGIGTGVEMREAGTKFFTTGTWSRGTNSSVTGTWLSSMIFGWLGAAAAAAAAAVRLASACSRKRSCVNGSAMPATAGSTLRWSGRKASKSGGIRITTSISGSVTSVGNCALISSVAFKNPGGICGNKSCSVISTLPEGS